MENNSNLIPEKFQDQISEMPEYKYGVNRIKVTLDDGTTFTDVFVAWGKEIIKVGSSEQIPFNPERIIKVEEQ
ncbi:MAG: hypothetical protein PHV60_06745 [bacterium]|nr:hypothetical protein [bacterium]